MKNQSTLLMIAICLFLPTKAFVGYAFLKAPTGQEILLLGDRHNENTLKAVNTQHAQSFVDFFAQLRHVPTIPCYLEFSEALQPNYINASTFTTLFAQRNAISSSLSCLCYEPRGVESDHLAGAFISFEEQFSGAIQQLLTMQGESQNKQVIMALPANLWQKIDQRLDKFTEITITTEAFLNALEDNKITLKTLLAKYQNDERIGALLQAAHDKYIRGQQKIMKLLEGKGSVPFIKAFFGMFYDCQTVNELLQRFIDCEKCFLNQTDLLFADVLFFDKILTAIQEGHKKIILITGDFHKKALKKMFNALGYETLDSAQLLKTVNQVNRGCNMSQLEALDAKLKEIYRTFVGVDCVSSGNIQSKVDTQKNLHCAHCSSTGKLLVCSRCKAVHYCNQTCQKAHWQEHKQSCELKK